MNISAALAIIVFLVLVLLGDAAAERQLLRSSADLGDPNGYCLDIPGFGPRMRKDAPIGTHTCKYNRPGFSVDEEFELTESRQLRLPEYDLCLSAESLTAGADVYTIACELDNAHAWDMHGNGRISPDGASDLCLTLSAELAFVNTATANVHPNSSRSVSLAACAARLVEYQRWRWSRTNEQDTESADTLRAGMSPAIAAGIIELGYNVRVPETAALYQNERRMFGAADVIVSEIHDYGPEKGQQLQVYHGVNRNHPRDLAPIILLVHGGGFARGSLNSLAEVATQFAGLGYVAVNMTYPLAPATDWPSGSRSVASAVQWIRDHAADIKGDPESIVVFGNSAGAVHVAEFIFRPNLHEGSGQDPKPSVAGAILASPSVALDPQRADAAEHPYYGDIRDSWQQKQVLGNVARTSIPVLLLTAEYDPKSMQTAAAELLSELAAEHQVLIRYTQLRGHNHTSYLESIGTADVQLSAEMIDFMSTLGD